jgi:hypothetical protein
LLQEKKFITIANHPITIDIQNLDLHGTAHSDERMTRDDNIGKEITEEEIIKDLEKALPKIINDFANGEFLNNSYFLVKNRDTKLNIVGNLRMQKGKDFCSVITVMRKVFFRPKEGTTTYEI